MFRSIALAFALGVSSAAYAAEGDEPAGPPAEAPAAKPAEKADEAFKARVKLGNGRSVTGVVKVAGSWERRDAKTGWTACGKDDPGACVRIWNVSGRAGFVTLPAKDVASIENDGALDADGLKKIADDAAAADKRAADAGEKQRKARQDRRAAETAAAEKAVGEAVAKQQAATDEARAKVDSDLLAKFPPEEWSAERRDEIGHRELIMKLMPTDKEREFVANYDAWARAAAAAKAEADAKAAAEEKTRKDAEGAKKGVPAKK